MDGEEDVKAEVRMTRGFVAKGCWFILRATGHAIRQGHHCLAFLAENQAFWYYLWNYAKLFGRNMVIFDFAEERRRFGMPKHNLGL